MTQHGRGLCTAAWINAIVQLHDEAVVATQRVVVAIPRPNNELVARRIHHLLQALSHCLISGRCDTANVGLALLTAQIGLSKTVAVLIDDMIVSSIDAEPVKYVAGGWLSLCGQLFVNKRREVGHCLNLGQDFLDKCSCWRCGSSKRDGSVSNDRCRRSRCRGFGCCHRSRVLCGSASSSSCSNRRGRPSSRREAWWGHACRCCVYTWWRELACSCSDRPGGGGGLGTKFCWNRLLHLWIRGSTLPDIFYTCKQTLPQNPQMATLAFWHS